MHQVVEPKQVAHVVSGVSEHHLLQGPLRPDVALLHQLFAAPLIRHCRIWDPRLEHPLQTPCTLTAQDLMGNLRVKGLAEGDAATP